VTPSILVAAAWDPELARVRERAAREPGLGGEARLVVEAIGVGLVEAGIGAARCLASAAPELALFVGTCGIFDPPGGVATSPLPLASVIAGVSVHLVSAGAVLGVSALPAPMPSSVDLDGGVQEVLESVGAARARIVNPLGITTDDPFAAKLAFLGHAAGAPTPTPTPLPIVEHLEAFAFARACARAAVPCGVVLGIANPVGSRGREAWLAHHVEASAAAGDLVTAALPALARHAVALRTTTTAPSPARR